MECIAERFQYILQRRRQRRFERGLSRMLWMNGTGAHYRATRASKPSARVSPLGRPRYRVLTLRGIVVEGVLFRAQTRPQMARATEFRAATWKTGAQAIRTAAFFRNAGFSNAKVGDFIPASCG